MSFILDALKKSEAERKRQDAPGIASIPAPTENPSGSKWIWIIAALLTINVVVLTGVVLRPDSDTATDSPSTAIERSETAATPPSPTAASIDEPVASSLAQSAIPTASRPAGSVTAASPAPAPQFGPAAPSGLPTFDELRSAGRLQLPDLHVDIHVYSRQPADRFVFVNMTKYKENAKLLEGPVVTRITPDGVELEYLGTAFLLPRE